MKIGDKVVMNDKYKVSDKNKGKVFVVRSNPWNVSGAQCVLLEGYSGGYAVDGLTVIECYKLGKYPCHICDGDYCNGLLNR